MTVLRLFVHFLVLLGESITYAGGGNILDVRFRNLFLKLHFLKLHLGKFDHFNHYGEFSGDFLSALFQVNFLFF